MMTSQGPPPAAAAAGALAACCTVHGLVIAGVVSGLSGLAVGGIAVGAGVAVAVAGWLAAILLRRRRLGDCADPPRGRYHPVKRLGPVRAKRTGPRT